MSVGLARSSRQALLANIATNYFAALWLALLSLALIPWYLRQIGNSQWGVVALCMSLQAIMYLLDAGLAQIMPRDVARVARDEDAVGRTFRAFATAYGVLAIIGFVIGQAVVTLVVDHWVHPASGTEADVKLALRIVLIQFLFQFANNAHLGLWIGMQQQVTASMRQCGFATAKHAAAIFAVSAWQPTVFAYLAPFALLSAVEYFLNRQAVLDALPRTAGGWARASELAKLRKEASLLAVGVVVGMLLSHADRIVLSGALDLVSFGHYAIVANLALAFLQLQAPVVRAFLPRLVGAELHHDVRKALRSMVAATFAVCVAPCILAAMIAPWLLQLWIKDAFVVADGTMAFRLILCAVALNSIYQIHYQKLLVRGESSLILRINALIALIVLPAAPLLVRHFGITGGGVIWLTISTLQVLLGAVFVRRAAR